MASMVSANADAENNNVFVQETSLLLRLLPTELVLKVLNALDFRTLVLCKRVCFLMLGYHGIAVSDFIRFAASFEISLLRPRFFNTK
jgi:hypothetical protein